jgi:outer membrane protein assembly factor BamE (lipoprotein component of BamABCDE complex)
MRSLQALVRAGATLAVTACLSCVSQWGEPYGFDPARGFGYGHLDDIKPGMDKEQVRGWIGDPLAVQALVDHACVERWMWFYYETQPTDHGFTMSSRVIDFDARGKVCAP